MPTTVSSRPRRSRQAANRPRLLHLEDDDSLRRLVEIGLQRLGYSVTSICNGYEAQQMILATGKNWDVIVTDIRMPIMDGLAFLRWFRSHESESHTPVIACTADADALGEARDAGADSVHLKPIAWHEFTQILQARIPH